MAEPLPVTGLGAVRVAGPALPDHGERPAVTVTPERWPEVAGDIRGVRPIDAGSRKSLLEIS